MFFTGNFTFIQGNIKQTCNNSEILPLTGERIKESNPGCSKKFQLDVLTEIFLCKKQQIISYATKHHQNEVKGREDNVNPLLRNVV